MSKVTKGFETNFTGWAFILAAILLWGGWALSSHHIGEWIQASDFEEVGKNIWYWIWMYRFHIFGWVTMAIASFALITILTQRPLRVVAFPGLGMIIVGTFSLAIANAFYYNFGAWGVGVVDAITNPDSNYSVSIVNEFKTVDEFMKSILATNNYVTCFIRFGRIFSGVGFVLLGFAFIKWNLVSKILAWFTLLFGVAAVAVILGIPDNFEVYKPLFHVKVVWLLAMGISLLRFGINSPEAAE